MPKSYRKVDPEVDEMIASVAEKYHPDLVEAGVTIYARFVADGSGVGCLKHRGYPAKAVIRRNSVEHRADGFLDATLTIDEADWDGDDTDERLATLDHELTHLELVRDKEGRVKEDSAGRPVLRMRLHDLVVGGFKSIVQVHGEAAPEFKQVQAVNEALRQQEFAFG